MVRCVRARARVGQRKRERRRPPTSSCNYAARRCQPGGNTATRPSVDRPADVAPQQHRLAAAAAAATTRRHVQSTVSPHTGRHLPRRQPARSATTRAEPNVVDPSYVWSSHSLTCYTRAPIHYTHIHYYVCVITYKIIIRIIVTWT